MKRILGINTHLYILTALALVILSSCRDQDFDWDSARANGSLDEFTNLFEKEFGTPQEGHQWGFDLADAAMGGGSTSSSSATRAITKQDNGDPRPYVLYTPPANITEKEHEEVYAWFSNHRVNWVTTPTYYNDALSYAEATTRQTTDGIAHVINTPFDYGSLANYEDVNHLGDYTINENLGFANGWVQHVNSTSSASHMDYLYSWGLLDSGEYGWQGHLLDFNNGQGYGYGRQSSNGVVDDSNQNAILVTDASFNVWSYSNSMGSSSKHDKYFLVYLKGDDYEGWYLGFDFESYTDNSANTNERVAGDGICNDWIIKITNVGSVTYTHSRIMCEDLGGSMSSGTDIDYNDIVFDVDYEDKGNNACKITITLQAAGGTLPIALFYTTNDGDVKLFEAHEYFYPSATKNKTLYQTMINTYGTKSVLSAQALHAENVATRTYTLFFNTQSGYTDDNGATQRYIAERFSLSNLKIMVYRLGVDDYVNSSNTPSAAEWIDLTNREGEAPLKICVPQIDSNNNPVLWVQERVMVTNGYNSFDAWVRNSLNLFWERSDYTVVTSNLYGNSVGGTANTTTTTVSVTGISINPSTTTLSVGSTALLTANVSPSNASYKTIEWTTSNSAVATIDPSGTVTAIAVGTATITAAAEDGSGKTATCTVTVTANSSSTTVIKSLLDDDCESAPANNSWNGWGNNSTRTLNSNGYSGNCYAFYNPSVTTNAYQVQAAHDFSAFGKGNKFKLSFNIKGSTSGTISTYLQYAVNNSYSNAGSFATVNVTTSWQTYESTTVCTLDNATRFIIEYGNYAGTIYIDNIKLDQIQ